MSLLICQIIKLRVFINYFLRIQCFGSVFLLEIQQISRNRKSILQKNNFLLHHVNNGSNYQLYIGFIFIAKIVYCPNYSIYEYFKSFLVKQTFPNKINYFEVERFKIEIIEILLKDFNVDKSNQKELFNVIPAIIDEVVSFDAF